MLYPLSYQGSFQLSRPAYALEPARIYHTGVLNFLARSFSCQGLKVPKAGTDSGSDRDGIGGVGESKRQAKEGTCLAFYSIFP